MTIQLDGATIFLGRLRKDGFRNVERIRLTSFRPLLAKLRKAGDYNTVMEAAIFKAHDKDVFERSQKKAEALYARRKAQSE